MCPLCRLGNTESRGAKDTRKSQRLDDDFGAMRTFRAFAACSVRKVLQPVRRAMVFGSFAGSGDELDEMIESLSLLAGLNVSERAFYGPVRAENDHTFSDILFYCKTP